jgi:tripartite ATP-independent transporter DctM subunit
VAAETLSMAMLAVLVLALLAGFPVAFTLAAVAAAFGVAGIAAAHFDPAFLIAMTFRMQGVFQSDNFLAIPFLVFMGMLLERTGIAEDMLLALDRLFGALRGGLAYTAVLVGAVLSAVTGFVSASVITMGLIALPVMLRARYDPRLASGVIAASGTLAQVLPPSLVLIVLAEQLDVPLIEIYRGALLPGALLIFFYLAYIFLLTRWKPDLAPPAVSLATAGGRGGALLAAAWAAGVPLALVLLVLASIYFGVATPGEGGAIGVTGALGLGLLRRRLTWARLRQSLEVSGVLCCGLMFLLFGASFFTLVFRGLSGHVWVESLFQQGPGGQLGFIVFLNVAVFLLAFVLDFFEIAFIVLPLVAPVAHKLGIDMVWLTVLLAVNLQTSFMHPPFGIALYNLRSVAPPSVRTVDIYWGAVPFIAIQLLMVGILIAWPDIVSRAQVETVDPNSITIELPATDYEERREESK